MTSWPTTSNLGLTDGTRQMLQDLLRLADQLTEDPERTFTDSVTTQMTDRTGRGYLTLVAALHFATERSGAWLESAWLSGRTDPFGR